ncbi:cysteine-rich receptor-like protein kinase 18, partial [Brachypodium distachyon]|uniref:cysteine-rich receptor-like protein kinase 18 n=1 Tax=Brachypodium distachyon TaxID=15368 RepID=UPI000D0CCCCC
FVGVALRGLVHNSFLFIYASRRKTFAFSRKKIKKIIKGICKGVEALHGQERPIIHLDLNPANILLDDHMEPKIVDFGLSRLFGENQTHTRIANSKSAIEYMAPEYLQRGQLSIESDIYSLGLLIIEITTGEKNCSDHELYDTDFTEDKPVCIYNILRHSFLTQVRECWTAMPYIKSRYSALSADGHRQVKRSIKIGLSCLKKKRKDRPTSGDIVKKIDQIGAGSSSVFGKMAVNVETGRGSHFLRIVLWADVLLHLM